MNILFYTTWEVSPEKGGTERITSTIATGLQKLYKFKCFSLFNYQINNIFEKTQFSNSFQIKPDIYFEENLYQILKENNIDIIINQGNFNSTKAIRNALERYGEGKLLTFHHFSPGSEEALFNYRNLIYNIKRKNDIIKNIIRLSLYPLLKLREHYKIVKSYNQAYYYSDLVVLLSKNFKDEFMKYGHISSSNKFRYIHNALSFNSFFDIRDYTNKQKEVLIVSRLDETPKRISIALKIWYAIEKKEDLKEWKLIIIGHGNDEKKYKNQISKMKLNRVQIIGKQNPEPYYKKASIFMMTSAFEGWGLTLTEAQQYGVVPIAFNSYASLPDIITNNENGIIIPNNNIKKYTNELVHLMHNYDLRKYLAQNAISTTHRFDIKTICEQWKNLIMDIAQK